MNRQDLIFNGEIKIWKDGSDFIVEYETEDNRQDLRRRYCKKYHNIAEAAERLFTELIKDGIVTVGYAEYLG